MWTRVLSMDFNFSKRAASPVPLRVRGLASGAITAFGIKVYGYSTSMLSSKTSNGASWVSSGLYSGIAVELDGVHNSVIGGSQSRRRLHVNSGRWGHRHTSRHSFARGGWLRRHNNRCSDKTLKSMLGQRKWLSSSTSMHSQL